LYFNFKYPKSVGNALVYGGKMIYKTLKNATNPPEDGRQKRGKARFTKF